MDTGRHCSKTFGPSVPPRRSGHVLLTGPRHQIAGSPAHHVEPRGIPPSSLWWFVTPSSAEAGSHPPLQPQRVVVSSSLLDFDLLLFASDLGRLG
jgi:hypothetical protein